MIARHALHFTALCTSALILLTACGAKPVTTVAAEPTLVSTTIATTGPANARMHFHGTIASRDEMRLSFKVGGIIKRMAVEAGAPVRRGQMLAEIDLAEINAQVAQSQQLADKATRDLQRGEQLRHDEVISLEQLQNLRTQREMAAAQLRALRFNQSYARITAPADGTVLRRLAEEHELVPAGQPVLIVGTSGRGYVLKAAVSDRELVQLHLGDAAQLQLDAAPNQTIAATVSELARAADPATGLFPIELKLEPTALTLASGMVAEAEVQPTMTGAAVAGAAAAVSAPDTAGATLVRIPASALVAANGDKATVFVAAGDRARRREVQIAFIDGANVAIRSGVVAGESVVSAGAPYLDDNALIKASAATP
jgi:RND family efflux transporter MFP subunit